jgi:hypothetical protein
MSSCSFSTVSGRAICIGHQNEESYMSRQSFVLSISITHDGALVMLLLYNRHWHDRDLCKKMHVIFVFITHYFQRPVYTVGACDNLVVRTASSCIRAGLYLCVRNSKLSFKGVYDRDTKHSCKKRLSFDRFNRTVTSLARRYQYKQH